MERAYDYVRDQRLEEILSPWNGITCSRYARIVASPVNVSEISQSTPKEDVYATTYQRRSRTE